jgi:hypothetical protein
MQNCDRMTSTDEFLTKLPLAKAPQSQQSLVVRLGPDVTAIDSNAVFVPACRGAFADGAHEPGDVGALLAYPDGRKAGGSRGALRETETGKAGRGLYSSHYTRAVGTHPLIRKALN